MKKKITKIKAKKSVFRFIPFLFVLVMLVILIFPNYNVMLSPTIDDAPDASSGLSFFALFISISFILSMIIVFIIYYVISKDLYS